MTSIRILIFMAFFMPFQNALAQVAPGEKIIGDFYQDVVPYDKEFAKCIDDTTWGNCATIALIKAAIVQYKSLDQIYKEFRQQGDTLYITFNDGFKVTLTKNEQETAKAMGGFKVKDQPAYFDIALILYTSVCKRVYEKRSEYIKGNCITTFPEAIHYINSGYRTEKVGGLLGMKLIPIKRNSINSREAVILKTSAHAAFCTYGKQDNLGSPFRIRYYLMQNPIGPRMPITGAFILSKTL